MLYHQQPEEGEAGQRQGLGAEEGHGGHPGQLAEDSSPLAQVKVQLQCGGTRREELEFYTARACQCDMCRLSRY